MDHLVANVERVARAAPRVAGRIDPERRIRLLADLQHGVVARWQLTMLRLPAAIIDARLKAQRFLVLHTGVYALGHRHLRSEGRWIAAALSAGPGAVVAHRDAAAVQQMKANPPARIAVITTRRGARSKPGVRVFTTRHLDPLDVTVVSGVPVTTPARTAFDISGVAGRAEVIRILNWGLVHGKLTDADLDAVVARANGRRGSGPARFRSARREIARYGATLTRSAAEELVATISDRHGLPRPTMNHPAAGYEIDAAYLDQRLAIEIDSYQWHDNRWSFVTDRRKVRALQLAGWMVLPFAAGDLMYEEQRYVRDVSRALGRTPSGLWLPEAA